MKQVGTSYESNSNFLKMVILMMMPFCFKPVGFLANFTLNRLL